MPNIIQVWKHTQQDDYAFSIDLKDAYLHIHIKHHHFLHFVLVKHTSLEGIAILAGQGP